MYSVSGFLKTFLLKLHAVFVEYVPVVCFMHIFKIKLALIKMGGGERGGVTGLHCKTLILKYHFLLQTLTFLKLNFSFIFNLEYTSHKGRFLPIYSSFIKKDKITRNECKIRDIYLL